MGENLRTTNNSLFQEPAVISPSGPAVFKTGPSCTSFSLSCWLDLLSLIDFKLHPLCWPPIWGLVAWARKTRSLENIIITEGTTSSALLSEQHIPYLIWTVQLLVPFWKNDLSAPLHGVVCPSWKSHEKKWLRIFNTNCWKIFMDMFCLLIEYI